MKKLLLFIVLYEKTAPLCLEYALFANQHLKLKKKIKKIQDGHKDKVILRINLMSRK
jgi:hypothetical protein